MSMDTKQRVYTSTQVYSSAISLHTIALLPPFSPLPLLVYKCAGGKNKGERKKACHVTNIMTRNYNNQKLVITVEAKMTT